jgi:hypothetical protein
MQALLLIGLTVPHGGSGISERLLDTLLGTLIATFFSYVLPSWEYQNLPRLVDAVLDANRKYVDAAADLLLRRTGDDFRYRISRKRFMDSLATLSAALGRMLDEPAAKQRAPDELNRFTVQNYLLVAHMAALRLLLQRYADNMPRAEVEAALESAFAEVRASLGGADGRDRGAGRADRPGSRSGPAGRRCSGGCGCCSRMPRRWRSAARRSARAADDRGKTLFVDHGQVAGMHPARRVDRFARFLFVAPIPEHHGIAAREEFAFHAARHDLAVAASTIFTSRCGCTRPMVDTRSGTGSSTELWKLTGEVSVMP